MESKKGHRLICTLGLSAAVLIMIFVLIQFHDNYYAVGGAAAFLLAAGYIYLHIEAKEEEAERKAEEEKQRSREEYWDKQMQDFQKIGKAVYTALKKNTEAVENRFDSVSTSLENMEVLLGQLFPTVEYLQKLNEQLEGYAEVFEQIYNSGQKRFEIQKNGMKAVMKYNKENAKQIAEVVNSALLQTDAKICNGFEALREELGAVKDLDLSSIDEKYEALSQVVLENTVTVSDNLQKINDNVNDVEKLLNNFKQCSEKKSAEMDYQGTEAVPDLMAEENIPILPETEEEEILSLSEAEEEENPALLEAKGEVNPALLEAEEEVNPALLEAEGEVNPALPEADMSAEYDIIPEQESASTESLEMEDSLLGEEIPVPLPEMLEEASPETEPEFPETKKETPVNVPEVIAPEPQSPPDPSKKMSPEEIAALIASLGN